jgi:hypothetical protein
VIISPKVRANVVAIGAMLPFLVLLNVYRKDIPTRTHVYLSLLLGVASMLIYMWVHSRATAKLPPVPSPVAELNLAEERLPRAVWLAVVPLLLVAIELWWFTKHGDALPWRHGARGAVADSSSYRFLVGGMIFWNSFAAWMVLFGLAVWHGMSRAYRFRRTQLLAGVTNQWAAFVGINGSIAGTAFAVPESRQWICFIPILSGFGVIFWNSRRLNRLYAEIPRVGTWFYRDPGDPTFFGPRGVNLASGWCWVLIAAVVPPILLAEWMLSRVPG